ncbi:hypothetical protein ACTJKY_21405 [Sphingomonas sp. 22176]
MSVYGELHTPFPAKDAIFRALSSLSAESVARCRAAQRQLNDSVDHPVAILPFHHELGRVHSILCDDVEKLLQI